MIHTKYSITQWMDHYFHSIASGASLVVLEHHDPDKVWILSFDIDRYVFYQHLGIEVSNLREFTFRCFGEMGAEWYEYILFECEKLTVGYNAPEAVRLRYKELYHIYTELEASYGDDIPLPQQEPELQNLVYACYAVDGEWRDDWGLCNILVRDDVLFLSDVIYSDYNLSPGALTFDPSQFEEVLACMQSCQVVR